MTESVTPQSSRRSSPTPSKSGFYWLTIAIRLLLGAVFLYSAITKIADVYSFGLVLKSYDLLPESMLKLFAITLPLLELVLGAAVLFKQTARYASLGIGVLSLVFASVMISKWGVVMPYGCGCFGPTEATPVGFVDVGKDVLLLLGAGLVLFRR